MPLALARWSPIRGVHQVGATFRTNMEITAPPALPRRDPGLEDARLEPPPDPAPLRCLPVCHYECSIGFTTQML
jgi:hypothetical protein